MTDPRSPAGDAPAAENATGESAQAPAQALRVLEAVLFAAAEPLDSEAIAMRLPEGTDVPALVADLEARYADRGVKLVRVAGKYALRTAPDLKDALKIETTASRKPSRAALETLAIIAYHQPVTRGEIEEIRGVALSKGTLDLLIEAGWVKPKGRRETPGRPATWVTTEAFLDHFGLDRLDDLPGLEDLKAAGLIDARPVIGGYREDDGAQPEAAGPGRGGEGAGATVDRRPGAEGDEGPG
ncbi:MAG: SMC-Scp complex subunit ScpB [Pseudomonadota bacterium]